MEKRYAGSHILVWESGTHSKSSQTSIFLSFKVFNHLIFDKILDTWK